MMTVTIMVIGMISCGSERIGGEVIAPYLREERQEEAAQAPRCEYSEHIAGCIAEALGRVSGASSCSGETAHP